MDLAVVIVTHNQHDLLRQCVRSVLWAMEQVDGEVIVVDNASTDATPKVMAAEFSHVRTIRNEVNLHYTRAMNQGTRATDARFVFLLNDDTEVEPDCFSKLIGFMDAHPRCGAVGPVFVSPAGEVQVSAQRFPTPLREIMAVTGVAWRFRHRTWGAAVQLAYAMPMKTQMVDWVCGGAMLVRRRVIEELGYHDENYLFYRDDPDLGMRLRAAGWEVWYCAETHLLHHHGASTVKTESKVRFELISVRSRRHYHRKFHGLLATIAVDCCDGMVGVARTLWLLSRLRFQSAAQQWGRVILLLRAFSVPEEEREAIAGYRSASYNGMEAT